MSVTLCNLGVGATFGESILHDLPRDSTVVTKTTCELLRVEQQDFRLIFECELARLFPSITRVALKFAPKKH
ncbi:epac [Anopheles darlingi]|uniref:Epac n=1 Tax=Anopheles darlingi TaxID=43151 RepID=W5JB50_ANODA|nr:epac [Anopheles darlingi]